MTSAQQIWSGCPSERLRSHVSGEILIELLMVGALGNFLESAALPLWHDDSYERFRSSTAFGQHLAMFDG